MTRIFVDAGHGGNDPGAVGPGGLREKDVNLAIALKLQAKLRELGYDGVLTRRDDTFLELEERTALAKTGAGDLFVSVHCNSTDKKGDRNASGVEVYYADLPSDRAAARLGAMENATSEEHMSELKKVLSTVARAEFTELSATLATFVQNGLVTDLKKVNPDLKNHAHGVKSALFYVLLTAEMPAILVETSFISNPKDEKRLGDARYQQTMAEGIARAIDAYLDDRARQGSQNVRRVVENPVPTPASIVPVPSKSETVPQTAKNRRASKRHP